jgi:molybdopterin/thiamine biosynthesis adenylyltransferase
LFEEVGDLNENDCADVGVLGPSVSMIASIQAQCVLKKLLNKPILEDGILRIDTSTMEIKKNKINTNYSCKLSP